MDSNPAGANYVYDAAGRLTQAYVTGHHYTYDFTSTAAAACPVGTQANAGANTNRMRLLDATSAGTAETDYCYDTADRLLATLGATAVGNLTYDSHGNTTSYTSGGVTATLGWDGADRNISAASTGTPAQTAAITYTRDVEDRIVRRDATAGDPTSTVLYSYSGSDDSADLTLDASKRVLTLSIALAGGVLLTLQNDASGQPAPTWDNPSVRGDICMTTDRRAIRSARCAPTTPTANRWTPTAASTPRTCPTTAPAPWTTAGSVSTNAPLSMRARWTWWRWAQDLIAPCWAGSSPSTHNQVARPMTTTTLAPTRSTSPILTDNGGGVAVSFGQPDDGFRGIIAKSSTSSLPLQSPVPRGSRLVRFAAYPADLAASQSVAP